MTDIFTTISLVASLVIHCTGGSMLPTFSEDHYISICTPIVDGCKFEDLEKDDIIAFEKTNSHGEYIIHRIIKVKDFEDGSRTVQTQGDNEETNPYPDKKIHEEQYIGKAILDTDVQTAPPIVDSTTNLPELNAELGLLL